MSTRTSDTSRSADTGRSDAPPPGADRATVKAVSLAVVPARAATSPTVTKAVPAKAAGTKAAGTKAVPAKAAGTKTAGSKAAGTKAAGTKTAATKTAGSKSAGTKAAGSKAAGTKAAGPKAAGPKAAGTKAAGTKSEPAKTAGTKSAATKAATSSTVAEAATVAASSSAGAASEVAATPTSKRAASRSSGRATASAASAASAAEVGPYADEPKFLEEQRELLETERAVYLGQATDLRAEADALAQEREPGDVQFDEESGEGGTVTVDRERDLALSAQALAAVEEIDAALTKIDRRTYGACERCHQPIPKARLRALPYARLCVACKSGGLSSRR